MDLLDSITSNFSKIKDSVEDGVKDVFDSSRDELEKAKKVVRGGSPKMFGHYLGKDNEEYDYPISKLRETNTVRQAENTNHDRLIDALFKPGKLRKKKFPVLAGSDFLKHEYSLDDMRDGEVFGLSDYNDADRSSGSVFWNKDFDTSLGLGSFKMRTKGNNLQFMKTKKGVLPYGYAEHEVNDIYDFDAKKEPLYAPLQALEMIGAADSYPVKAQWKTRPVGVIRLLGDKVDKSGVEWE